MTTFEITIIVLLVAIVVLMVVLLRTAIEGFHGVWQKQDTILGDTLVLKAYFNTILEKFNDIIQQLDNIENSNDQDFEKLTDIVDKMHRNLCVDIADKMVDRVCPSTRTIKVKGQRCELTDEELMKRINEDNKED